MEKIFQKRTNFQKLKNSIKLRKKSLINKIVLSIFVFIAVSTLIMKIVDGILIDYGFGIDKLMHENWNNYRGGSYQFIHDWDDPKNINNFHKNFWENSDIVYLAKMTINPNSNIAFGSKGNEWAIPALHDMVSRHPNTFWIFTQFTWITTIIIILFLILRLFKYETIIPSWLKWVMSQRTLSLIAMYATIVAIGYWAGMFYRFADSFNPELEILEYVITIIVHAVIPFSILVYSIIFLIKDSKASILKETFVLKGIMYPIYYALYYVLIATTWNDPYSVSNLKYNFNGEIWKIILALFILWIMLGIMLLIHNYVLINFNKKYDPRNDYEVIRRRNYKIEKIQKRVTRQVEKRYKDKINKNH